MHKVGIISQARMSSTRLPGKVLMKVKEKTILEYHIQRLKASSYPIFIATTTNPSDDALVSFCEEFNLPYYRGDEQNVLSRFVECAEQNKLDVIVRVTSDCPLIDGDLVKKGIEEYLTAANPDLYISNGLEETYPRGFDFEIFSFAALKYASEHATTPYQKEHVTPYLIENVSGKTELNNISRNSDDSQYRLTLDTQDDFRLIEKLIVDFDADKLNCEEIISVLKANPDLEKINGHIQQKTKPE